MTEITVIGGGIAGLVAASEAAEAGAQVRLLEARSRPGGRGRSTAGEHIANFGPHALYTPTALWTWLRARNLHGPARRPFSPRISVRWRGQVRRRPPAALVATLRLARQEAPVDRDLRSWVTDHAGPDAAQVLVGAAGPLTFDHDPGRLSAAFVMERYRRILLKPAPTARYVVGGWSAMVDRMAEYARGVGVQIQTSTPVDTVDDLARGGPVVVALDPPSARRVLGDDTLQVESPRVALLDLALTRGRDPYIVLDLDESAFFTRTTAAVRSLAPGREQLVQTSVGLRPGEGLSSGEARLEVILDAGFPVWRDRVTWRRRGLATEATGALDLPGTTWRDRQPVAYADGIWLAGDWVAAPGHLAEVSCTSAIRAATAAVSATRRTRQADPVRPALAHGRGSYA